MEILPNVHRIETVIDGRRLYQFFLAAERGVLIDVGEAEVPGDVVFPYLESIGVAPEDIGIIVVTHADTDHHGGLAAVRRACPSAWIGCGLADRSLIEDAGRLVVERYQAYEDEHAIGYPPGSLDRARRIESVAVDVAWVGGEVLRLEDGWEIELVATPGHSEGHLSVLDRRHDVLYCGDALHGAAYPDVSGRPLLPPNYIDVEHYQRTIDCVARLAPASLCGAHWPVMTGPDIERFLSESLDYVETFERLVIDALTNGCLTARDVIRWLQDERAVWPNAAPIDLAYATDAHLRSLAARGAITSAARGGVLVYELVGA